MRQCNREQIDFTIKALNRSVRERELSDFRIESLRNETLRLVGSFDLSYYHDIEIAVTGVSRLSLCSYFYVDLAEPEPFAVSFPSGDAAVLRFTDRGAGQPGEIEFEGEVSFLLQHVTYSQ